MSGHPLAMFMEAEDCFIIVLLLDICCNTLQKSSSSSKRGRFLGEDVVTVNAGGLYAGTLEPD